MGSNAEFTLPKLLPKASLRERIAEWLMLLRIIFTGSGTRSDLTYNVLAQRHVMGDDTLFINLGYWDKSKTLDDASYEMADVLAEKADLQPDDTILDVGFGFGDQDIHWCKTRNLQKLHGVNISSVQVQAAQERVQRERLQDRIHLREGDAIATGFATDSFDKVMGLECAFHFCTREDFFREAHRVLRSGGRLTLADFIARDNQPVTFKRWVASFLGRRSWQIPAYNLYAVTRYRQELEHLGFRNIRIENINAHVFDHFVAYQRQRFDTEGFKRRYHPLIRFVAKLQIDWGFLDTLDYIIVTAEK
ncbi:MAG TPA: class I SAM-dependent methyltransferase [Dongiaceae bacterium]|nr:class I SAM-dependent methyltransferase [Dongiaceae bacterium]